MSFSITILGSSASLPTTKRFSTAHAINIHERFFLVDCGEGTQIQLQKFKIKYARINHIFISHLHGDHFFGIFGLLSTYSLLGRKKEIHIYAHQRLDEILNSSNSPLILNELGYEVIFHKLNFKKEEALYEDKMLTIKSFPLKHRIPVVGFLFSEKQRPKNIKKEVIEKYDIKIPEIIKIKEGADYTTENGEVIPNRKLTIPAPKPRSYAFCTDTLAKEKTVNYIKNVDLLYHEATYDKSNKELAKKTGHSTSIEAAEIAKKAKVKKLIMGHFSPRYKDILKLEDEAKNIFPDTVAVNDGDVFNIKY